MAEKQFQILDATEALFEKGSRKIEQPSTKNMGSTFIQPIAKVHQIHEVTKLAPSAIRKSLREIEQLNMIFGGDRRRNRRFYQYDLIRIMSE